MKKFYLIASLGLLMMSCNEKDKTPKEEAVAVGVEVVYDGANTSGWQTYVGEVEGTVSTSVSFTGSGTLVRICVSEGQTVRKGELLAEIDRSHAEAQLSAAQAALTQAKDALGRMKQLHDSKSIPEMQWVETQSKYQQAQAEVKASSKQLADCRVYAPYNGVVGSLSMDVGETVLPAMPVMSIVDINKVKVKVSIPEQEISRISAKSESSVTIDALDGKTFRGGKIEKGVVANSLSHTYDIKVNMDNPTHAILPGMVCKVRIDLGGNASGTCTVPINAVQKYYDGRYFVWHVNNGRAQRRMVKLGTATGDRIGIEKGISNGDTIVVSGYHKLSENTLISM